MIAGAEPSDGRPSFDVALFVGYHARAGHPTGTIAHTYTGAPTETRLNGRPTGEYGFNALALGAWGIPVGLVAGDDGLAAEVEGWLPWAERVVVKQGFGTHAAASLHPERARDLIRTASSVAVDGLKVTGAAVRAIPARRVQGTHRRARRVRYETSSLAAS